MFKQLFSGLFSIEESLPISVLEQTLSEKNTILVDVREKEEFINGHIPQAHNVPLSQIDTFNGRKDTHYLLVCQSGMRSQRATAFLKEQGYHVTNIEGGMNAWNGPIIGGNK
ncbi:rhodanese-like domain-containing protein [Streptococcus suis]|nr:rhodanese-like domain-containing protein [Streptococcus suis]